MPRIRRSSNVIAKAIVRSNNLKAISPTLDLGGGLTVAAFDELIAKAEAAQDDFNQTIAILDEKGNILDDLLKQTRDMSARLLAGVGARHGKNSNEYEKAGGVRQDEIKRDKPATTKATKNGGKA
jgi:hypothetical protein